MDEPLPVFKDDLSQSVEIKDNNIAEHQWKLYNARFEYAWRYFDFHATQRTTMFNFFVVFSGFLINGCFLLLQNQYYLLLIVTSLFGTILTRIFIFLERRNEELVHISEDILRTLEQEVLFKNFTRTIKWPKHRTWRGKMDESYKQVPLGIFLRQDYDEAQNRKSKYLHGTWLPRIQLIISYIYLVFVGFAGFYLIAKYQQMLWMLSV